MRDYEYKTYVFQNPLDIFEKDIKYKIFYCNFSLVPVVRVCILYCCFNLLRSAFIHSQSSSYLRHPFIYTYAFIDIYPSLIHIYPYIHPHLFIHISPLSIHKYPYIHSHTSVIHSYIPIHSFTYLRHPFI